MARKKLVSFRLNEDLLEGFLTAAKPFYGKLGLCYAAAVLMFIDADPRARKDYLDRIFQAETEDEVKELVAGMKAEALERAKSGKKSRLRPS